MDNRSQKIKILEYMRRGKNISPKDAERICGSMRLAARIADLRADGYTIGSAWKQTEDGKRFKEYWLVGAND